MKTVSRKWRRAMEQSAHRRKLERRWAKFWREIEFERAVVAVLSNKFYAELVVNFAIGYMVNYAAKKAGVNLNIWDLSSRGESS